MAAVHDHENRGRQIERKTSRTIWVSGASPPADVPITTISCPPNGPMGVDMDHLRPNLAWAAVGLKQIWKLTLCRNRRAKLAG